MVRRLAVLSALLAGVAAAAEPSAGAGRELFDGARPFRNGGAPCGACHDPGGPSLALAATLGPELATGLAGMDAAALDGLLESMPFPTMAPIYGGRPLTPGERADLSAFLLEAAREGPPPAGRRFEGRAAVLAAVLFLALALAWRRRKGSTRDRLLARAPHATGGSR